MSGHNQTMTHPDPAGVACPQCFAEPSEPCVWRAGSPKRGRVHRARSREAMRQFREVEVPAFLAERGIDLTAPNPLDELAALPGGLSETVWPGWGLPGPVEMPHEPLSRVATAPIAAPAKPAPPDETEPVLARPSRRSMLASIRRSEKRKPEPPKHPRGHWHPFSGAGGDYPGDW